MSPPRPLPLMGLRTLRSIVCARPAGASGSPHPSVWPFPVCRAVLLRAPSPISCEMGSSSRESQLPCRVRPLRARPVAAVRRSSFRGVPSLFATSTGGIHRNGHPKPASFRPRRFSRPRRLAPPPALRVCFAPQPRPGFRSPGGFPPTQPYRLVDGPYPRRWLAARCPVVAHPAPRAFARLQGLLCVGIRCVALTV